MNTVLDSVHHLSETTRENIENVRGSFKFIGGEFNTLYNECRTVQTGVQQLATLLGQDPNVRDLNYIKEIADSLQSDDVFTTFSGKGVGKARNPGQVKKSGKESNVEVEKLEVERLERERLEKVEREKLELEKVERERLEEERNLARRNVEHREALYRERVSQVEKESDAVEPLNEAQKEFFKYQGNFPEEIDSLTLGQRNLLNDAEYRCYLRHITRNLVKFNFLPQIPASVVTQIPEGSVVNTSLDHGDISEDLFDNDTIVTDVPVTIVTTVATSAEVVTIPAKGPILVNVVGGVVTTPSTTVSTSSTSTATITTSNTSNTPTTSGGSTSAQKAAQAAAQKAYREGRYPRMTACGIELTSYSSKGIPFRKGGVGEKAFVCVCPKCPKDGMTTPYSTVRKWDLFTHYDEYCCEDRKVSNYECSDCGNTFKNFLSFQTHTNIHTHLKVYSCKKCKEGFWTSSYRSQHQKRCKKSPKPPGNDGDDENSQDGTKVVASRSGDSSSASVSGHVSKRGRLRKSRTSSASSKAESVIDSDHAEDSEWTPGSDKPPPAKKLKIGDKTVFERVIQQVPYQLAQQLRQPTPDRGPAPTRRSPTSAAPERVPVTDAIFVGDTSESDNSARVSRTVRTPGEVSTVEESSGTDGMYWISNYHTSRKDMS